MPPGLQDGCVTVRGGGGKEAAESAQLTAMSHQGTRISSLTKAHRHQRDGVGAGRGRTRRRSANTPPQSSADLLVQTWQLVFWLFFFFFERLQAPPACKLQARPQCRRICEARLWHFLKYSFILGKSEVTRRTDRTGSFVFAWQFNYYLFTWHTCWVQRLAHICSSQFAILNVPGLHVVQWNDKLSFTQQHEPRSKRHQPTWSVQQDAENLVCFDFSVPAGSFSAAAVRGHAKLNDHI